MEPGEDWSYCYVDDVAFVPAGWGMTARQRLILMQAFHHALEICAALVATGGLIAATWIEDLQRAVAAQSCSGGQLVGVPGSAAEQPRGAVPAGPAPALAGQGT